LRLPERLSLPGVELTDDGVPVREYGVAKAWGEPMGNGVADCRARDTMGLCETMGMAAMEAVGKDVITLVGMAIAAAIETLGRAAMDVAGAMEVLVTTRGPAMETGDGCETVVSTMGKGVLGSAVLRAAEAEEDVAGAEMDAMGAEKDAVVVGSACP